MTSTMLGDESDVPSGPSATKPSLSTGGSGIPSYMIVMMGTSSSAMASAVDAAATRCEGGR